MFKSLLRHSEPKFFLGEESRFLIKSVRGELVEPCAFILRQAQDER